jgi:hypothetical protein
MKIDCDTCAVRGDACTDCVVSFLLVSARPGRAARPVPGPIELDEEQEAAILTFSEGGLVPPLRHIAS